MLSLNDKELFAYRIYQHGLLDADEKISTPFTRIVGIQAQNQRAAELNVALQTGTTEQALQEEYQKGKFIRSWGQRWTIHLYTPDDWQLVINARQNERIPKTYFLGMSDEIHDSTKIISAELHDRKRLTRDDYEKIMGEHFKWYDDRPKFFDYTVFQLLSAQGQMVIEPQNSQQGFDLCSPKDFQKIDQTNATVQLIKRYIHGFGPASIQDFAKWAGIKMTNVRPGWKLVEPELYPITWRNETLWTDEPIEEAELKEIVEKVSAQTVIAAGFCSLMTGYQDKGWFVDREIQDKMWSKNGLLRAPIISHNKVVGKWNYQITNTKIKFLVEKWGRYNTRQLEQQFKRLSKFLEREYGGIEVH